jgi:hypothetical protein
MSEHSEPHESLHLTVVQESAKNYHSFIHKRKTLTEERSIISRLKRILTEEDPVEQSLRQVDTAGFN